VAPLFFRKQIAGQSITFEWSALSQRNISQKGTQPKKVYLESIISALPRVGTRTAGFDLKNRNNFTMPRDCFTTGENFVSAEKNRKLRKRGKRKGNGGGKEDKEGKRNGKYAKQMGR
jgi:hypothetical protein